MHKVPPGRHRTPRYGSESSSGRGIAWIKVVTALVVAVTRMIVVIFKG